MGRLCAMAMFSTFTLIIVAVVGLTSLSIGAAAQSIEFTFAPPDGTRGKQTVVETRNIFYEDGEQSTERVELDVDFQYQKIDDGYQLTETTLASRTGVETNPIVGQIFRALEGLVVNFRIHPDGQLADIDGLGDVATRLQMNFPDDMASTLATTFGEDVLVVSAAADWMSRVGTLAGRKFTGTAPVYGTAEYILPYGGALPYFTASQVLYPEECPSRRCVRVLTVFDSDKANVDALLDAALSGNSGAAAARPLSLNDPQPAIRGSNFRLIDPTTMLVYEELNLSTIRSLHQPAGQSRRQMLTGERREYRYVYYY